MAFNIQGAIQSLIARSSASSKHMCAKYVRMAMESGGLNTSTRPDWAWKYISWLPSQGWSLVGNFKTNDSQAAFTSSAAKPGDVAVYQKPSAGSSQPGHICMWSGSNWISDFRQNRMGVYSSPVNAYVFRYTGQISNCPIDISGLEGMGDGGAGGFGSGGFVELNTETLLAKCPEEIEFKGMWMRYQLQAGEKSPIMQEFMNNASGDFGDFGWDGNMAELEGTDAFEKALNLLSHEERGKPYNQPFSESECVGIQLKGEKYKTYGFGQVYSSGGKLLQDIKPVWSEQELREDFKRTVAKEISAGKSTGLPFTDNQLAVMSHRYHAAPACFNYIIKRIKGLGGIPDANGYREIALEYMRSCKNWNIYAKGWTNGINREAALWS